MHGDASKVLAKGTKRTENSIDYVNRLNGKLNNLRKLIPSHLIMTLNMLVKPWKANETATTCWHVMSNGVFQSENHG